MKLITRPVKKTDALELAPHLRDMDRLEVRCVGNHDALEALQFSASVSLVVSSAVVDGRVVGMFGVAPAHPNSTIGMPWLLASDDLFEDAAIRHQFLRQSVRWRNYYLRYFQTLTNLIHRENEAALQWLSWLGFSFSKDVHVLNHEPFLQFYLHRQPCVNQQP